MKKMAAVLFLCLCVMGCSKKKSPEGPYGLWKGMDRDDINLCCQIEKTAQVNREASIMKVAMVPKPDEAFRSYYLHFTRTEGVFAVNSSTGSIPVTQAQHIFDQTVQDLTSQYGLPTREAQNGDLIWDQPRSRIGIFRITASIQPANDSSVVVLFYIFDNNKTYS